MVPLFSCLQWWRVPDSALVLSIPIFSFEEFPWIVYPRVARWRHCEWKLGAHRHWKTLISPSLLWDIYGCRWNTCEIHGLMVIALKSNLRGGEFKTGRGKVKLGGVLDMVLVLPLFPSLYYLFVCFFFPFHLFSFILFFSPSFFFPFTLCHSFLFSLCFFPFSHYLQMFSV